MLRLSLIITRSRQRSDESCDDRETADKINKDSCQSLRRVVCTSVVVSIECRPMPDRPIVLAFSLTSAQVHGNEEVVVCVSVETKAWRHAQVSVRRSLEALCQPIRS